jgi:hypothetical protein
MITRRPFPIGPTISRRWLEKSRGAGSVTSAQKARSWSADRRWSLRGRPIGWRIKQQRKQRASRKSEGESREGTDAIDTHRGPVIYVVMSNFAVA